jgi:phenylalanyl-tRNA synthetase alpha chain
VDTVDNILNQARADIAACDAVQELENLRVRYLGKKGEVTALLTSLGGLEP